MSSSESDSNSSSSTSSESEGNLSRERARPDKTSRPNVRNFRDLQAHDDDDDDDDQNSDYSDYSDEDESNGLVDDDDDGDFEQNANFYRKNETKSFKKEAKKNKEIADKFKHHKYNSTEEVLLVHDDSALQQPFDEYRITLEPSTRTPQLFYVPVKKGKEFTVLSRLYRRTNSLEYSLPLAAFTPRFGSEYIFVEARALQDVQDLVNGVQFVSISGIKNIQYNEMSRALTITREKVDFKPGEFIRYTKNDRDGKYYKGDIGQVITVKINKNKVLIKSIPRIDYELLEKTHAENDGEVSMAKLARGKSKEVYVVPKNDFDESRLNKIDAEISDTSYNINGQKITGFKKFDKSYFYNSFLYNESPVKHLEKLSYVASATEGKKFEESITPFEKEIPGFRANMLRCLGKTTSTSFRPGDVARILDGHEYANLIVDVKNVKGEMITVVPHDDPANQVEFEVEIELLEKYFRYGDRVEVTAGVNRGKVGTVISVNKQTFKAKVQITSINQFIEVELANLAHTNREEEIQTTIGRYRLEDYVILTDKTDGVIWRIENDVAHVLLSTGKSRPAELSQIQTRAKERFVKTRNGAPIAKGTIVKHKTKRIDATVLHTCQGKVFLKSDRHTSNNGIFVANPDEIQVPQNATTTNYQRDFTGGAIQSRPRPDREIQGKTIRIRSGPYKGQVADIKSATDKELFVLLQQSEKRVHISRESGDKNFEIITANKDSFKNSLFNTERVSRPTVQESRFSQPQYQNQPYPPQYQQPPYTSQYQSQPWSGSPDNTYSTYSPSY